MISKKEIAHSGIFDFPVFTVAENNRSAWSGENKKKIAICLFDEPDHALTEFLGKVMGAVKVDIQKDTLTAFLTPGKSFSFTDSLKNDPVRTALFFGIRPIDAGLNFETKKYAPFSFAGKTWLFADQLSTIQQDAGLKRLLWEGLKTIMTND